MQPYQALNAIIKELKPYLMPRRCKRCGETDPKLLKNPDCGYCVVCAEDMDIEQNAGRADE